jgi:hypothetical protein
MMLRFPAILVVPSATAKWLSYFLETRRRGKTDWSGGYQMLFDTLRYVPYAWRHRQPMATKQLVRFKRLRNHPEPLMQLQPAMA